MRDVVDRGKWVFDGATRLRELCNYSCAIEVNPGEDRLLVRYADAARIELMHRKYRSLDPVFPYKTSYGALLYDNQGVDQIEWVIRHLHQKIETKSATIGLHTPGQSELSCLSLLDFKVRDDAVHMTCVYRSQNVFASQPGNLLALRRVQEDVGARIGVDAGRVELVALSAHIYEDDLGEARRIVEAYDRELGAGF
jgi:thymidylate synthase